MDHVDTILSVVGLIVGLVALAFALPPFFQMMGGGPNVRVSFDESNEQGARFLLCRIHNLPIRNRALRWMRVSRTPTEIFAMFDVREHGTKRILASAFRAELTDLKSHTHGLVLLNRPPLPVIFTVVQHNDEGAFTFNHAPSERERKPLAPGEYFATIKIASGEATVDEVNYSFTIGPNYLDEPKN